MCTYHIQYIESVFYIYISANYMIVKSGLIFKKYKIMIALKTALEILKYVLFSWCSIFPG
jgi:hypothetical protein